MKAIVETLLVEISGVIQEGLVNKEQNYLVMTGHTFRMIQLHFPLIDPETREYSATLGWLWGFGIREVGQYDPMGNFEFRFEAY